MLDEAAVSRIFCEYIEVLLSFVQSVSFRDISLPGVAASFSISIVRFIAPAFVSFVS